MHICRYCWIGEQVSLNTWLSVYISFFPIQRMNLFQSRKYILRLLNILQFYLILFIPYSCVRPIFRLRYSFVSHFPPAALFICVVALLLPCRRIFMKCSKYFACVLRCMRNIFDFSIIVNSWWDRAAKRGWERKRQSLWSGYA